MKILFVVKFCTALKAGLKIVQLLNTDSLCQPIRFSSLIFNLTFLTDHSVINATHSLKMEESVSGIKIV